jgi:hypothetical protein
MATRKNKDEAKVEAARGAPQDDASAVEVNVPISDHARKARKVTRQVHSSMVEKGSIDPSEMVRGRVGAALARHLRCW